MNEVKKYLLDTRYEVDLQLLYTIHSASNFAYFDNYCAIILKLGPEMLKVSDPQVRYILTVWKKGGNIIFKEPLQKIPYCWNTCGSKIIYMKSLSQVSIIDCEQEEKLRTFDLTREARLPEPLDSQP